MNKSNNIQETAEEILLKYDYIAPDGFVDSKEIHKAMEEYAAQTSNWISVDTLPDEHVKVQVHLEGGTVLQGIIDSNNVWAVYYHDGCHGEDPERRITHWQPLPATPNTL
jgi:hypothetical protein